MRERISATSGDAWVGEGKGGWEAREGGKQPEASPRVAGSAIPAPSSSLPPSHPVALKADEGTSLLTPSPPVLPHLLDLRKP